MDTHQLFLESVRSDFADVNFQSSEMYENYVFLQFAEKHRLCSFLSKRCPGTMLDDLRDAIDKPYAENTRKRGCAHEVLPEIAIRAQAADVRFAVIKGLAFERCVYGGEGLRDIGDIDILVAPEDAVSMHRVLLDMGYSQRKGPTSTGDVARKNPRAFIAAHAKQAIETFSTTEIPVKRHTGKPQYVPYIRQGSPSIELHDGFYHLAAEDIRFVFNSGFMLYHNAGFPTFDERITFLFLLANTFENSESFFSNSYDFGAVLRDYVDIRFFFNKYHTSPIWEDVANLIEQFGLIHIAEVILGNLYEVYGRDVTYGVLPHFRPKGSDWGVGILDRMHDPGLARKVSLFALRNALQETAASAPFVVKSEGKMAIPDLFLPIRTCPNVQYGILHTLDVLILLWLLPHGFLDKERYLLQFKFYPLVENIPYTAYKVDYCFYDDRYRAFGHKTHRFYTDAIRKTTNTELAAVECDLGPQHLLKIELPFDQLGLSKRPDDNDFCVSLDVLEQYCEHIYRRVGGGENSALPGEAESGPVSLLKFEAG